MSAHEGKIKCLEMENITSVLPEECIAKIISKKSPSDACRLSLVSTAFSSAAASNLVWEGFLPPDYQHIISESVSSASSQTSPLNMLSKKDLYFSLCYNPILIGNRNRSFAIHKWSGKKCYMLGARQIDIAWGDIPVLEIMDFSCRVTNTTQVKISGSCSSCACVLARNNGQSQDKNPVPEHNIWCIPYLHHCEQFPRAWRASEGICWIYR
ncbi:hypothetical protein I3760_01G120300 [Carya illinoinensis]|nr:hypothetical protein I3760_01G120300 [Carya illinoinensis]